MLADPLNAIVVIKNLKPKDTPNEVTDRDGMYAQVAPSGTVTFRFDYRLHSR